MALFSAVPARTQNALGAVGVGLLIIALLLLTPEWHKAETQYSCPPDYRVETVYKDMLECSKAMESSPRTACRCSRPENPWARLYADYFVPLLVGLVASLLFVGSIGARIGLLHAGFWGAIFLLGAFYALTKPVGAAGLALSIGQLIYVAVLASAVVAGQHLIARGVKALRQRA